MKTIKNYDYSYNHVKQRFKQRHNIIIDREEYRIMNNFIRLFRNKTIYKPISVDNNGDQEVWSYTRFDKDFKIVYSISKDRITTVLPDEEKT